MVNFTAIQIHSFTILLFELNWTFQFCCICSPSQMMLLVLLWLWSNEDLLNLGFHEVLVIDLSTQLPSSLNLKQTFHRALLTFLSQSHFQLHTRSCQCTGLVHRFSAPLNRCVWTLRYAHHQQLALYHSIKDCNCRRTTTVF